MAREENGEFDAAETVLRELSETEWASFPRDAAFMDLGSFLERHGRADEARELYSRLSPDTEFSESVYSGQARSRLQQMGEDAGEDAG